MRTLIILASILGMCCLGCMDNTAVTVNSGGVTDSLHTIRYRGRTGNYTTLRIDGCQYIVFFSSGGVVSLTHKGNCDNPIHPYAPHALH